MPSSAKTSPVTRVEAPQATRTSRPTVSGSVIPAARSCSATAAAIAACTIAAAPKKDREITTSRRSARKTRLPAR